MATRIVGSFTIAEFKALHLVKKLLLQENDKGSLYFTSDGKILASVAADIDTDKPIVFLHCKNEDGEWHFAVNPKEMTTKGEF